jgi:NAD+ diphosphatase
VDTVTARRPIAFAGADLDRADHLRSNPAALAARMDHRARLLLLNGIDPTYAPDGGLAWGSLADAAPGAELIFLGLNAEGRACFAAAPDAASSSVGPPPPGLWAQMATMRPAELATYGVARSLAGWHARHRFCPRCGHGTVIAKGGWQRDCTNPACRAEHFPRTDPVVIMTIEHDGALLLGRQPRFPPHRYSALAGFLEPGESIEECVARESFEEAGVRLASVHYIASQPWPFPSSLMIGCHAIAMSRELTIDRSELDDARWFTRAEVAEAMAAGKRGAVGAAFEAPPPHAVAWHLLDSWLLEG